MDYPFWLLVPWLVFAVGMGLKVCRLSRLVNHWLRSIAWETECFRTDLAELVAK